MHSTLEFLIKHGYVVLLAWVFAEQLGLPVGGSNPDYSVILSPGVELGPGTYWVSVQGHITVNNWYWEGRNATNNSATAWRNPGNGYGTGCTDWARLTGCIGLNWPDQMFRLSGTTTGPLTNRSAPRRSE